TVPYVKKYGISARYLFFQAEDGIRDRNVTGVQTCALPIYLERRGWLAIASLRLVAAVPFSLLNYAAALTAISVGQFAVATLVGSIPTTAIGVFFGDLLTGQMHPEIIAAMIVCALVGIGGLILDSRMPVTQLSQGNTVD